MHCRIVDLWRYRGSSGERNFIERIKANQGSNFLGGTFSNRDHVRTPIQFRRESQLQHLKK